MDNYTNFKQSFLDQMELKGYDTDFLEGFFKRAEAEYQLWERFARDAYQDHPAMYKQAFYELACSEGLPCPPIQKWADETGGETGGSSILDMLNGLGTNIGSALGIEGGPGLGGLVAGGGGGLLLGFILSQLFNIPLSTALLLGTLGGGALGAGLAGTESGRQFAFGTPGPVDQTVNPKPEPPQPEEPVVDPALTPGEVDPSLANSTDMPADKSEVPVQEPVDYTPTDSPAAPTPMPNPAAQKALGAGQQAANQAAQGVAPQPPVPAPSPAPPVTPPAPPTASTNPVVPPQLPGQTPALPKKP